MVSRGREPDEAEPELARLTSANRAAGSGYFGAQRRMARRVVSRATGDGGRMGQLWDQVQAYIDRHGTSERQLAKRLGYSSPGGVTNWREPRQLPSAQALARVASLSG